MLKKTWRSRWVWYSWFGRRERRSGHGFWGNEGNMHNVANHKTSFNTRISKLATHTFGRYNYPVREEPHEYFDGKKMVGANQRIGKLNKYNKYRINRRISLFNAKQ